MIVLDACAALDIVLKTPDGEAFRSLMAEDDPVLAPYLFCAEVSNGLRTLHHAKSIDSEAALAKLNEALGLVDEFVSDKDLLPEALQQALLLDRAAYDLFYLVLARQHDATLFTRDHRLITLCDRLGIDCIHIIDLNQA